MMTRTQKITAALALSLPIAFGSPALAATSGVDETATPTDPVHDAIAQATLELERATGIEDPSAPSN